MSRITHVHADSDEWVVVHRDPPDEGSGWVAWLQIAGGFLVIIVILSIPLWLWITLGCLLLVGGILSALSALGAFDGNDAKPAEVSAKTSVVSAAKASDPQTLVPKTTVPQTPAPQTTVPTTSCAALLLPTKEEHVHPEPEDIHASVPGLLLSGVSPMRAGKGVRNGRSKRNAEQTGTAGNDGRVRIALHFPRRDDEWTDEYGELYITLSARRSRSGLVMAKSGGRYAASVVEFDGVRRERESRFDGPRLRTVESFRLECPSCGAVAATETAIVRAARRAGIVAPDAETALRLHGICPLCGKHALTGFRPLDICGPEGEAVLGAATIAELRKACDGARNPFVIPPVVALLPDPEMEGSPEEEVPGEFPGLMSRLVREAAEFEDEEGRYPLRVCDISAFASKKYRNACGWQLVMPDVYAGVASREAVERGFRRNGKYRIDLKIPLPGANGKETRPRRARRARPTGRLPTMVR